MPVDAGGDQAQVDPPRMPAEHLPVIREDLAAVGAQLGDGRGLLLRVDDRRRGDPDLAAIPALPRQLQMNAAVAGHADDGDAGG